MYREIQSVCAALKLTNRKGYEKRLAMESKIACKLHAYLRMRKMRSRLGVPTLVENGSQVDSGSENGARH